MVARIVLFNSPIPLLTVHLAWGLGSVFGEMGSNLGIGSASSSQVSPLLIPEKVSDSYPFNKID